MFLHEGVYLKKNIFKKKFLSSIGSSFFDVETCKGN